MNKSGRRIDLPLCQLFLQTIGRNPTQSLHISTPNKQLATFLLNYMKHVATSGQAEEIATPRRLEGHKYADVLHIPYMLEVCQGS